MQARLILAYLTAFNNTAEGEATANPPPHGRPARSGPGCREPGRERGTAAGEGAPEPDNKFWGSPVEAAGLGDPRTCRQPPLLPCRRGGRRHVAPSRPSPLIPSAAAASSPRGRGSPRRRRRGPRSSSPAPCPPGRAAAQELAAGSIARPRGGLGERAARRGGRAV